MTTALLVAYLAGIVPAYFGMIRIGILAGATGDDSDGRLCVSGALLWPAMLPIVVFLGARDWAAEQIRKKAAR